MTFLPCRRCLSFHDTSGVSQCARRRGDISGSLQLSRAGGQRSLQPRAGPKPGRARCMPDPGGRRRGVTGDSSADRTSARSGALAGQPHPHTAFSEPVNHGQPWPAAVEMLPRSGRNQISCDLDAGATSHTPAPPRGRRLRHVQSALPGRLGGHRRCSARHSRWTLTSGASARTPLPDDNRGRPPWTTPNVVAPVQNATWTLLRSCRGPDLADDLLNAPVPKGCRVPGGPTSPAARRAGRATRVPVPIIGERRRLRAVLSVSTCRVVRPSPTNTGRRPRAHGRRCCRVSVRASQDAGRARQVEHVAVGHLRHLGQIRRAQAALALAYQRKPAVAPIFALPQVFLTFTSPRARAASAPWTKTGTPYSRRSRSAKPRWSVSPWVSTRRGRRPESGQGGELGGQLAQWPDIPASTTVRRRR